MSITIPDGVTSIGDSAFRLSAVSFLGDAPKIEDKAFEDSSPSIYREADAKGLTLGAYTHPLPEKGKALIL